MDTMNQTAAPNDDAAPLLDRNLYKVVKRMDRVTLEGLLNDIFERGRRKGLAEAGVIVAEDDDDTDERTLDLREVEKDIRAVKGIGEKRAEEIMGIYERHLGVSDTSE